MRKVLLAILFAMFASLAFAGGNNGNNGEGNQCQGNSCGSGGNGGNGGGGGNANNSVTNTNTLTNNNTNVNSNSNKNSNKQSQKQSQYQGQSQAAVGVGIAEATATGNGSGNVTTFNDRLQAPGFGVAALAAGSDTCMGSASGTVSVPGIGLGKTYIDTNCERIRNVKLLYAVGDKDVAKILHCTDKTVADAYKLAGKPCVEAVKPEVVSQGHGIGAMAEAPVSFIVGH